MTVQYLDYTYLILEQSKTKMKTAFAWNDRTKRIVYAPAERYLFKDAPSIIAQYLSTGWKEIQRGKWEGEQLHDRETELRQMHQKKLSTLAEKFKWDDE